MSKPPAKIGLVGVCGAGKSTLAAQLQKHGIQVRQIAQEHSYAPQMWRRISNPDFLIYLDVSYPVTLQRKQFNWQESEYLEQKRRVAHARQHADLYIDTDQLTPEQIAEIVLAFLAQV